MNTFDEKFKTGIELEAITDNLRRIEGILLDGTTQCNSSAVLEHKTYGIRDKNGEIAIIKAYHLDGSLQLNGGGLNYLDGSINCDNKFTLDGDGKTLSIDEYKDVLDGSMKWSKPEKNKSFDLIYPELRDELPGKVEKITTGVEIDGFTENLRTIKGNQLNGEIQFDGKVRLEIKTYGIEDACGKITIGRGHLLDGHLQLGDNVQCALKGKMLNFEVVTDDLCGGLSFGVSRIEYLPIATKTKSGYVIIGNGIEVYESGKISIEKINEMNGMSKLVAGELRKIFNERVVH